MVSWNNLDTLASFKELADVKPACLTEVMSGDNGADRVKKYSVPMPSGSEPRGRSRRTCNRRAADRSPA